MHAIVFCLLYNRLIFCFLPCISMWKYPDRKLFGENYPYWSLWVYVCVCVFLRMSNYQNVCYMRHIQHCFYPLDFPNRSEERKKEPITFHRLENPINFDFWLIFVFFNWKKKRSLNCVNSIYTIRFWYSHFMEIQKNGIYEKYSEWYARYNCII